MNVELGSYAVTVAAGALDTVGDVARAVAPAHRYVVITDAAVAPHYASRVAASFGSDRPDVLCIPPGEAEKTRATWARLTDEMLALGCGRDTTVVALGGGVVGDLAGFVAATFMRGVPYVQVPTTLLAMIDAAIGGKTAVDTPAGKNLVGAFHQPAAVVADPETLRTLPPAHLRAGLAEAVKHGAIADAAYFHRVAADAATIAADPAAPAVLPLVRRSVEIKAAVVRRDEREGGLRKTLNFGHTLGHAIESVSGYRMLHGEAVAIGMVLESALAEVVGVAEPGTAAQLREGVARAGLPVARPRDLDPERILEATRADKKARGGSVEYALPLRIGAMAGEDTGWGVRVDDAHVRRVLAAVPAEDGA